MSTEILVIRLNLPFETRRTFMSVRNLKVEKYLSVLLKSVFKSFVI